MLTIVLLLGLSSVFLGSIGFAPGVSGTLLSPIYESGTVSIISPNVPKAATSLAVSCPVSTVNVGRFTTCTATVTGSSPSGDVTFATSSTGTFTPSNAKCTLSAGSCSIAYVDTSSSSGTVSITASYLGDSHNKPSSGTASLNISKPAGTVAVAASFLTVNNGGIIVDQSSVTGISVTITGSTAANGTPVGVSTEILSGPSLGIPPQSLSNPSYFDVFVTGLSSGSAQVCITFSTANSGTVMQFWDGRTWSTASSITVTGGKVCGAIPVSALTGTNIALGNAVQQASPPPMDYTLVYVGAAVAIVLAVGVFLGLRRRQGAKRAKP